MRKILPNVFNRNVKAGLVFVVFASLLETLDRILSLILQLIFGNVSWW